MFKFNRLVCVLLACGLVGVVWGAVRKIPSFVVEETLADCDTGNPIYLDMDPNADGMAILNYASGADKTIVQVIVSDFTGALSIDRYIVRLSPDVGDLGTFLVDSQGNGHFHGEISGNVSDSNIELWQQVQPAPGCPAVLIATGQ